MNWSKQPPLTLNPSLVEWLTKPQKLSLALKKSGHHVTLRVSSERFDELPYLDEIEILKHNTLVTNPYYVREVFLLCDENPVVFAKTIMPHTTYEHYKTPLKNLGDNFIGESLLYNIPNIIRHPFEFSAINDTHPIMENLSQLININKKQVLWARRSLFSVNALPILITEVFLPEVRSLSRVPLH